MAGIARRKCIEILNSYTCDLSDYPDTREVRAREIEDSGIFKSTFRRLTAKGMREIRYYRLYESSFSRSRTKFDECCWVQLCSTCRIPNNCDNCSNRRKFECSEEKIEKHKVYMKRLKKDVK